MNSLTNTRRQLRFQKRREQSRARLACQTKEEHERRLQLRREVHKRCEQSRWAKKRSQEAQKRLKAKRQRYSSRLQCQTAEQRARRLVQSESNAEQKRRNQRHEHLYYTTSDFVFETK